MTNREWLNTLTNAELSSWLCETSEIIGYEPKIVKIDNEPKNMLVAQFDNLYPRLRDLVGRYSSSYLGIEKWLSEERNNDK